MQPEGGKADAVSGIALPPAGLAAPTQGRRGQASAFQMDGSDDEFGDVIDSEKLKLNSAFNPYLKLSASLPSDRDRPEIFRYNFHLHCAFFGFVATFHIVLIIVMKNFLIAAFIASLYAGIIYLRVWLHRKVDQVRAQEIGWRMWYGLLVFFPCFNVAVNITRSEARVAAEMLAFINSASLMSPAMLITGLQSGSFGIGIRRKCRLLGGYMGIIGLFFMYLNRCVPDHAFDICAIAVATFSCFLAGACSPCAESAALVRRVQPLCGECRPSHAPRYARPCSHRAAA